MLRVAQIDIETRFVVAVVRPVGVLNAPEGMLFFEIEDGALDPCGMYYVGGDFQVEQPE